MTDNALIVIETLNALTVFGEGGAAGILAKLRTDALAEAKGLDISTPGGRKAIASLAFKIARSKTALDDMGKDLVSGLKAQSGKIDADRRLLRDGCDELKDEVRKPLTDWENAEKARTDAHEAVLAEINTATVFASSTPSSAEIMERVKRITELATSREWQEYKARAGQVSARVADALAVMLRTALDREAEETKRQKREREEAERRQKEHDERVAQEARERAQREAQEAAERERQRVEAEKAAAAERARKAAAKAAQDKIDAETALRDAEQRRKNEAIEAAERLKREKAKREADAVAAVEKLKREKEASAQRERDRIAAEQAKEAAAAERREASARNRKRVTKEAVAALCASTGLSADQAGAVFLAIAEGKVPRVTVEW